MLFKIDAVRFSEEYYDVYEHRGPFKFTLSLDKEITENMTVLVVDTNHLATSESCAAHIQVMRYQQHKVKTLGLQ